MATSARQERLDDRRSRRADLKLAAMIELGAGRSRAATICNVSAHGVMAEIDIALLPGRPVTLVTAALGRTAGRVAWVRDGHVGIGFVEALTIDQINALI